MSTAFSNVTKQLSIINAFLDEDKTILVKLSHPLTLPVHADHAIVTDTTSGQAFSAVAIENVTLSTSSQTDLLRIRLADIPELSHQFQLSLEGYRPCALIARNVLNSPAYTYNGDDLGNICTQSATAFRLWAPTASAVQLQLYHSESGPLTKQLEMQRAGQGTWYLKVEENLTHWYYLYQVTVQGVTQTAVDPYVRASAVNATRGMIIDLQTTNPPDWQSDQYVELSSPVDAVVYEVHVRDFSVNANSGMINQGKYLAFSERGTTGPSNVATGVDSLKQLGITHVQLLPVTDFASIDESDPSQYNWGYDPRNYNVPQGAYATTPHGQARISEYKCLVQSLHREHVGIIMDVVYNHTFAMSTSDFDKIVPRYYYRTDDAGNYTNGSGVGNEIATERPMVQKFVRDSLKYWMSEYHIDGFRFDLMALLGVNTMRQVVQDLRKINPHLILYGEPWTGGASPLPSDQLLTKGQQKGLGLGVFNDQIRNELVGSVFSHSLPGFVTGAPNHVDTLKKSVAGSVHDFAAVPGETINYVTSHDNLTLWDKISASASGVSEQDRINMDKLAQAIIMTAQGVAFMQGGEEFLRTKGGNDNSYNAGDAINQFDWARKAQYQDVFDYYAGLIHLRLQHPAFRLTSAERIDQCLTFLDSPDNTIAFSLNDHANGDPWRTIIVIYNPNRVPITVSLPPDPWTIVANQQHIDPAGLGQATTTVTVSPISCLILYQL